MFVNIYLLSILHTTNFSDVFSVGRWPSMQQDNSTLRQLSKLLPVYCLKSKAASTSKQYRYSFNTFCDWCHSFEPSLSPLPASDTNVALYCAHLAKRGNSSGTIQSACHAISWSHSLAGFKDPCDTTLVKSVKEGAIRECSKPIVKKEPILPEHLCKIVDKFANDTSSLSDIRVACMCLLSYAGFLRFSELSQLKRSNVTFMDNYMILYIEKSKTDIYREGSKLHIARTYSKTCPVSLLERYLKMARILPLSQEFLFRSLSFCKKTCTYLLKKSNQPISYSRAREIVLSAFEDIGLDKTKFGLHSLRSGGASASAAAGVSDRLFKKHGRWRSETAKDGYVKESVNEKLTVTKMLGI